MTVPPTSVSGTFDLKHALAVASRVDGLEAKLTALLHDVVEDRLCGFTDLSDAELPETVIDAVHMLTRVQGEAYIDYIERVATSGNELAIYVKAADLDANLSRMDEEHASLAGRYRNAQQRLRSLAGA